MSGKWVDLVRGEIMLPGCQIIGEGGQWRDRKEHLGKPWHDMAHVRTRKWVPDQPETPKEEDILEEALRITGGDRQNQYGPPDQDFRRVAGMMNALFADKLKEGAAFEPFNIAQLMILMKMSRQLHQRKRDNWTDTAGYARCGQLCDEQAKKDQNNVK